eukprot:488530-Rhodomonas_salina.2
MPPLSERPLLATVSTSRDQIKIPTFRALSARALAQPHAACNFTAKSKQFLGQTVRRSWLAVLDFTRNAFIPRRVSGKRELAAFRA